MVTHAMVRLGRVPLSVCALTPFLLSPFHPMTGFWLARAAACAKWWSWARALSW